MVLEGLYVGFGSVCWSGREGSAGVWDLDYGLKGVCEGCGADDVIHGELDVVIDLDPDIEVGLKEVGCGSASGSGDEGIFADDPELTAEVGRGGESGCEIDPRGQDGGSDVSVGVGGDVD